MGIDAHAVHLLRHATRKYGPLGRTVTLGRQSLHLGPRAMKRWTGLDAASGSVYCESMLKEHFGASVVDSIDNSPYEGATHVAVQAMGDVRRMSFAKMAHLHLQRLAEHLVPYIKHC